MSCVRSSTTEYALAEQYQSSPATYCLGFICNAHSTGAYPANTLLRFRPNPPLISLPLLGCLSYNNNWQGRTPLLPFGPLRLNATMHDASTSLWQDTCLIGTSSTLPNFERYVLLRSTMHCKLGCCLLSQHYVMRAFVNHRIRTS